jgi:predicted NUDIX family phosphoesterase
MILHALQTIAQFQIVLHQDLEEIVAQYLSTQHAQQVSLLHHINTNVQQTARFTIGLILAQQVVLAQLELRALVS